MSETKKTRETKQTPAIQSPVIPDSLPLEFSSSNTYVPASNTTDPAVLDEKEHARRFRQASSPLDTTPLARTNAAAPAISDSKNLRELLRPAYEVRAKIRSLVFTDHELPIHEVHFTLDQYNEEQEKARLIRRLSSRETKETKSSAYYFEKKDDKQPEDAWSSLLHQQRGGEMARQPVAVNEIFTPNKQLAEKIGKADEKGDAKNLPELPIHRVLIIGPPGSGKTTLSKYLARQWSVGKLWQERYRQIFWLTLRDLGSPANAERLAQCKASPFPLATLIHQFGLDEAAQQQIGIKQIHQLLTTQPQQTLLMLDGFDEVAQAFSDSSNASPLKSLLTTAMKSPCDLMVTSRGYSLPPNEFQFDRRLVNQGFTDEQTKSYIQQHFGSLLKPDAKQANEVQRLIQSNYRLWTHAHNPLILSLTCDFYRDAYESGKTQLAELSLVDLYDNTLCIFMRRYLNTQSQILKKPELEWEKTKNWSQSKLLSACIVEIDFLQTLALLGVKAGVQRFDRSLKKEASTLVESRFSHAKEDHFILALQLGLLHEFPSAHASPLYRTHEFTHLTFQEYLAARYLAERLQNNDPEAYEWLRTYKYHASYRQIFDFLCALMPPKSKTFWRVLLEEQTDLTGFGQLSLKLYSLEAGHFHPDIPGVRRYVDETGQLLIHYVKVGKFIEATELQTVLEHCPHFFSQLGESFWRELKSLLTEKAGEMNRHAWELLNFIAMQAGQLSSKQRQWLWTELSQAMGSENPQVQAAAVMALGSYAAQVGQLTAGERSELLKTLLQAVGNQNPDVQRAAAWALGSYAAQAGHLSAGERSELLKTLLQAAGSQNPRMQAAAVSVLQSYAAQAGHLTAGERSELLKALLQAVGNENDGVREAAAEALGSYAGQAGQLAVGERSDLLRTLLQAARNESPAVQVAAAEALGRYAGQAGQLAVGERSDLLRTLLQAAGNGNYGVREAAAEALGSYAAQAGQLTTDERSDLLKALLQAVGSQNPRVQAAAVSVLQSCAAQAGQLTTDERSALLKALLQAAGSQNFRVHEAAAEALKLYADQAGHLSAGERNKLLKTLLQAAGSQNPALQQTVTVALGRCADQAGHLSASERAELLATLLQAVGNENDAVQVAAAEALKRYADQAGQLAVGECSALLKTLLQAVGNENDAVQVAAAEALGSYAAQTGQLATDERSDLLKALLQAVGSQNFRLHEAAAEALKRYADQAGHLSAGERSALLKALLHLARNENPAVQQAAVEALRDCAKQVGQFTVDERSELLKALLHLAEDENPAVQRAAAEALRSYAAQAGQLTADERTELLKALLHLAGDENPAVQRAAAGALRGYAEQAGQLTADGRTELLKALLHLAGNENPAVQRAVAGALESLAGQLALSERIYLLANLLHMARYEGHENEAFEILNAAPWTHEELLADSCFPEADTTSKATLLKWLLVKKQLLRATPLAELLHAYAVDTVTYEGLKTYPRRSLWLWTNERKTYSRYRLWLRFVVARVIEEGATLTIVDGGCELHGPQLAQPVRVLISEERLRELAKALANQAKEQSLPVYMTQPPLPLPAEIHTKPSVQDSHSELTAEQLTQLTQEQNQLKREVKETKARVDVHDQRLDNHELRLQDVEKNIDQLKSQVQAHEIAFKAQETAMADLRKEVKTIGKELEDSITTSKAAIQKNEEELRKQEAALSQLTEQLNQREKEAKEQGKNIESLGENYNALQQQQRELQDKCEKSEAKLLKQYEELADQLKTRLDAVEKADAKQDKISRDLQEKQQALEESLKKMGSEIEALQSADVHTLEELQKLQKLQARQKDMVEAFEATQKQLQERQTLLSDPKFAQFYRVMHLKLSGFFLVCTVVATGLIKAESQASLSEKIAQKFVGVLGDNIPVPGAKAAASFINAMITWHSENCTKQGREHAMDSAPISFSDKEAAIDLAVQEVIRRYGQHIKVLTEKGVADLAECGVNRIAHGIQDEALFEPQPPNFPLYLVQFLHRVKLKQGKLGHKDLATEAGIIAQGKKPWNEDGIFRRTGIQSSAQYHYSDKTEHSYVGSGKPICRYQKYGFRQVDDAKLAESMADQQEFDKTSTTLPTGSFQFKPLTTPLQPAPQGPLSMWGKTKQAAVGAAENKLPDAAQWASDHRQAILENGQSVANQVGGAIASSVTTVADKVMDTVSKSFK
jgi:coenzyme F420-reducing hydrogenase delta subunit